MSVPSLCSTCNMRPCIPVPGFRLCDVCARQQTMNTSSPPPPHPQFSVPISQIPDYRTPEFHVQFSKPNLSSSVPLRPTATKPPALQPPVNPAFFVCDIQEGLRHKVHQFPSVMNTATRMVLYAKALRVPVFVAEQTPSILGGTVSELSISLKALGPLHVGTYTKNTFSMVTPGVLSELDQRDIQSVVIFGVESHISVIQTVLELLRRDIHVYVLADGVSSQNKEETGLALDRMKQAGAIITSSECIAFELLWDTEKPVADGVYAVNKSTKAITAARLQNLVGDGQKGNS